MFRGGLLSYVADWIRWDFDEGRDEFRRERFLCSPHLSHPPRGDMSENRRHAIEARLARIEGHIHAVHRMAHEGKSYPEIVHQVSAIRSSLDSVVQAIVEDLVRNCVHTASTRGSVVPAVEELQAVFASAL